MKDRAHEAALKHFGRLPQTLEEAQDFDDYMRLLVDSSRVFGTEPVPKPILRGRCPRCGRNAFLEAPFWDPGGEPRCNSCTKHEATEDIVRERAEDKRQLRSAIRAAKQARTGTGSNAPRLGKARSGSFGLPSVPPPKQALDTWLRHTLDCMCESCMYFNAHLDDEDDQRVIEDVQTERV